MYTLLLRLSGPLQSWGADSVYDNRETDPFPTKSGVLGMLAAALGRKRDEPLDDLAKLEFGVRVDLPGTKINDFQITQMGEKLNTNLSNRAYLCDAIFLAGLGCEDIDFLKQLEGALKEPKFTLFLGRRSCPPTLPLVLGIRNSSLYQSLMEEEWLVPQWRRKVLFRFADTIRLRIVTDCAEGRAVKKDVPLSFSSYKRVYGYRYIKEQSGKIVSKEGILGSTEHDPMMELR